MDDSELQKWDRDTAVSVQERTHFYSLTLAFTLLALSINTIEIKPDIDKVAGLFEFFGILSFVISGVVGLIRMMEVPGLYNLNMKLRSLNTKYEQACINKESGEDFTSDSEVGQKFKTDEYLTYYGYRWHIKT